MQCTSLNKILLCCLQKEAAQRELSALLKPILLRRNKSLIRDQLPTKRDHVVFFNLAPLQMAVYRRILELPDAKLVLAAKKTCPCGSGDKIHQCEAEHCPGYWRISEEEGGLLYPRYHFCQCGNEFDPLTNKRGCKWHRPMGCWRETTVGLASYIFMLCVHVLKYVIGVLVGSLCYGLLSWILIASALHCVCAANVPLLPHHAPHHAPTEGGLPRGPHQSQPRRPSRQPREIRMGLPAGAAAAGAGP